MTPPRVSLALTASATVSLLVREPLCSLVRALVVVRLLLYTSLPVVEPTEAGVSNDFDGGLWTAKLPRTPASRKRFAREVEAVAAVQHPNVIHWLPRST